MDVDVVFINVISLATSASNMPPMHFVCHLWFFYYCVDGRNHFKNNFKKLRTDLRAKSVLGPNREMAQNVGTKSAFMPNNNNNNIIIIIIIKAWLGLF